MSKSSRVLLGLTAALCASSSSPQPTMAQQGADATSAISADFPYESRYVDVLGSRMHYVDENPQGKETFLCLHGEPTWGYLYRNIIPPGMEFS